MRSRTSRTRSALLVVLLALAAGSCDRPAPGPTVVLVVRHAEKASDAPDSPLTEAGQRRAEALARVGEGARVGAIYTSQFKRNHDTARPLAERTGVAVTEMPVNLESPGDYGAALARDVLARHRGETVVVVSHLNTVPAIVEALSGQPGPALAGTEYANLFVVIVPEHGPARVLRTQFGQPDPA